MKKQLAYVGPLRAAIISCILYGILGCIFAPFFVLAAWLGSKSATPSPSPAVFSMAFAILIPVFYAAIGFVGGLVGAALYNLIAKWTGGFIFEVTDVPPGA